MFDIAQEFSGGDIDASVGVTEVVRSDPNSAVKRFFDILFASAMLVAFLPLFLLIGLTILVTDGGRPFYGHRRVGRNGREFSCLKFRTMVTDSDTVLEKLLQDSPVAAREWAETRKLRNDPRILPVIGHLLRQTSLDELPQIINVLRGDMSIVGPRPVVQDELERYGNARGLYLSVRPGLTGPWQAGNRSDDSYENRVRLDAHYVLNWSMAQDVRIVAKTAKIFLSGRSPGAY
jgi:exopolysaccharide production protein ExoY